MSRPRRAWATIEYDGKDITEAVTATLLSLDYVDKASDEADELNIKMHDHDGHWMRDWYPKLQVKGGGGSGGTETDYEDYDDW